MIGDMPTISDASHSHTLYGLGNLQQPLQTFSGTTNTLDYTSQGTAGGFGLAGDAANGLGALVGVAARRVQAPAAAAALNPNPVQPQEKPMMPARRLVQVFIADSDENVPLEKSMLYSGEQKLTDLTDQELFFEIEIKAILEKHNVERITFINKKVKERVEHLEPAKIRDLKMVVVNVATF